MNEVQASFGRRASQLEGNGAIGNPYRKIVCFGQREGKVLEEQNEAFTKIAHK
jgi:hypothetical protein